jgi:tRNA(His) guanylyltransferase
MDRKSVSWKQEFLYQNGINFNNIKDWQKRGIGMYWREHEKEGYNPITEQPVIALRKTLTKIVLPKEHEEFIELLNHFV